MSTAQQLQLQLALAKEELARLTAELESSGESKAAASSAAAKSTDHAEMSALSRQVAQLKDDVQSLEMQLVKVNNLNRELSEAQHQGHLELDATRGLLQSSQQQNRALTDAIARLKEK